MTTHQEWIDRIKALLAVLEPVAKLTATELDDKILAIVGNPLVMELIVYVIERKIEPSPDLLRKFLAGQP